MENTKGSRLFVRIPAYVIGLLIMTLGVAISVKSNLGVSPVSSIPYTITCVVGLEMGKATILFFHHIRGALNKALSLIGTQIKFLTNFRFSLM